MADRAAPLCGHFSGFCCGLSSGTSAKKLFPRLPINWLAEVKLDSVLSQAKQRLWLPEMNSCVKTPSDVDPWVETPRHLARRSPEWEYCHSREITQHSGKWRRICIFLLVSCKHCQCQEDLCDCLLPNGAARATCIQASSSVLCDHIRTELVADCLVIMDPSA